MSKQKQACPDCMGTGTLEAGEHEDKQICPYCGGTGEDPQDESCMR